jgi:tetratricopeptide (TPR) repeat protein
MPGSSRRRGTFEFALSVGGPGIVYPSSPSAFVVEVEAVALEGGHAETAPVGLDVLHYRDAHHLQLRNAHREEAAAKSGRLFFLAAAFRPRAGGRGVFGLRFCAAEKCYIQKMESTTAEETLIAALEQHRAGNLPAAEQLYRQVLSRSPLAADAWHLLGALCIQTDRPAEAVDLILRALSLDKSQPDFYSHLGAAYGALARHDEAVTALRHAVRLAPQSATAHYNLGTALRNAEQFESAVGSFRHAIAADPQAAEAHYNLANTLREMRRVDEAEESYRAALRARPNYIKAMINLGNLLTDEKRYDEAIETLRAAVAVDPNHSKSHLNLGSALRDARRFDEAVAELSTSVALDPRCAEAHNNLGTALQARAEFDEAIRHYEQALQLDPKLPDAHFSLGTQLLRQGDLARGFAEYEWRWRCKSFSTRHFDEPRWDGSPLAGRTILLHAEQGLGDTLHFARYAAEVKATGGTVVLECPESAMKILATCAGLDRVVVPGMPLPAFDVECPLMSLPGVLGLSMENLSRGAYLSAEPARVETSRRKLADIRGFRVGICWQGNPKHLFDGQRSVPLAQFAPLAAIGGVRLVSLQKGFGSEQIAGCGFDILELGDELDADGAFLDTAAVMKSLDLVIGCDTAAIHLAGALGAPVWVTLSEHSDWRWFIGRADSPWYPTMCLFRQTRLNQWEDVFGRVAAALAARVSGEKR